MSRQWIAALGCAFGLVLPAGQAGEWAQFRGPNGAGLSDEKQLPSEWGKDTNMRWKDAARNSVGRAWGKAPSLIEIVPGRITLPVPAKEVHAWALDGRGQRQTTLSVQEAANGNASLTIGSPARTLWYEIEVK